MRDARDVGVPALYARPFLQMLSCLVEAEMLSRFGTCESKLCGCKVAEWSMRVCHSWMGQITRAAKPKEDPIRVAMLGCARAALHMSAMASRTAHDRVNWDVWHPSYGGHLGRQTAGDFHWAVAFLDHHYGTQDEIAVADTFVMLSQARDISLWANEPAFVQAIIVGMRPEKTTRVRDAALRTAWQIREALSSPDDAILPLLPAFSSALRSAVLTNIYSEGDTAAWDSPDRDFYEERNLHYVQIVYALVRSSGGIWDRYLHDNGHFNRCLSLTKYPGSRYTTIVVYLAAIVENLEARGAEQSFTNDDVEMLIRHAWHMMIFITPDLEELLEALIVFTRRHRGAGANLANDIRGHVQSALSHLQQEQPHSSVIGSLNEFRRWLG
ncbi:hypothetical protein BV22DRAFT_457017 [Leucogyrophana mollusca]|uniref:Uncharacterized protein n=1 Tax=Leucogyrophana mollusca TaxID=85980 RepID=A0ACB8BHR4_9AGAM|nr:hypothetical protein BV22DRAFT_457017 [Leucogyrophana mollusca]